jgi:hypothetical protein
MFIQGLFVLHQYYVMLCFVYRLFAFKSRSVSHRRWVQRLCRPVYVCTLAVACRPAFYLSDRTINTREKKKKFIVRFIFILSNFQQRQKKKQPRMITKSTKGKVFLFRGCLQCGNFCAQSKPIGLMTISDKVMEERKQIYINRITEKTKRSYCKLRHES